MRVLDENGNISDALLSIVRNTNDFMFIKNKDFVYVAASEAFAEECIGHRCVEEVIGKTDFELFENQELAKRYRRDDESLFASRKGMEEFQEVIRDRNGKAHVCLTAKYLLFDKSGEPVAIFGQYHNVEKQVEQELKQRRILSHRIANALNGLYLASNYCDLRKNTFITLRGSNDSKSILEMCGTLEEGFDALVEKMVKKDYQNKMRKFCRMGTLVERLKDKTHIDCEYQSNLVDGWCQASFIPAEWDEAGEVTHALFVISEIDMAKAREIEDNIEKQKRLSAIWDKMPGGLVMYQWDGTQLKTIYISEFYKKIYGENSGSPDFMQIHPDDAESYKKVLRKALEEKHNLEYVFRVWNRKKERYIWTKLNAVSDLQADGTSYVYAMYSDVTMQIEAEKRMKYENTHDSLTGLYNRTIIFKECRRLLDEHPTEQFAMLHFDIKQFRLYNTFFGEKAGDKLLCDIAEMFRSMDADYDYWAYGRVEADVFCVFFPICRNKYQKHLDGLLNGLNQYRDDFQIEPSIGIYQVIDSTMPIESMFARATIAAKSTQVGSENKVTFFDDEMEKKITDTQNITQKMKTALAEKQFQVYLQPKYSLLTNQVVGAEALVRWMDPVDGMVSPGRFIPVFENNGFISSLDRYMWEEVCILIRKWMNEGRLVMPISVNVSRISMYSNSTVSFLKSLVQKYDIDPKYLGLELTESAYMDDPEDMKNKLKELQDFGFQIWMDDFGKGYSSFNTLRELPVNVLKLDMQFLPKSRADVRGCALVSAIVEMSHKLNLLVVAEGVETEEQAEFLREFNCKYVQGFLFARPMPVERYEKLLEKFFL